jgi:hypothetical protein
VLVWPGSDQDGEYRQAGCEVSAGCIQTHHNDSARQARRV